MEKGIISLDLKNYSIVDQNIDLFSKNEKTDVQFIIDIPKFTVVSNCVLTYSVNGVETTENFNNKLDYIALVKSLVSFGYNSQSYITTSADLPDGVTLRVFLLLTDPNYNFTKLSINTVV